MSPGPTAIIVLICFPSFLVASNDCISFDKFATCNDIHQVTSLPPKIETLVINGGSMEILSGFSFSHLTHLTELNIQNTHIGVIVKNAFSDVPELDLLSISDSNISIIETGAFFGLRGLSSLDISQCIIGGIKLEAFSDIENVHEFTIKTSNISFVDSKAFYNISAIRKFQFYENNVTLVKARAFSEWSGVMTAIVKSNTFGRLECFSDSSFIVATSVSFFRNYLDCECHLAWILTSPLFKDMLLSNMCHIPGTRESLGMSIVSLIDLQCPKNPSSAQMGCPNRPETASISFVSDVGTVPGPSLSGFSSGTHFTTSGTTDASRGNTPHDQTQSTPSLTHFTDTPFMASLASSDVTRMNATSSTDPPLSIPSGSGQSSTCRFHDICHMTLLTAAVLAAR